MVILIKNIAGDKVRATKANNKNLQKSIVKNF